MGVALLNPQDCLKNPSAPQPITFPSQKIKVLKKAPISSSKPNRSIHSHQNHPKRNFLRPQNDPKSTRPAGKPQPSKLVMGEVKILKRGEQLTNAAADPSSGAAKKSGRGIPVLGSTERSAPKSQLASPETISGLYAGSSMYVASPPPSSVPLPAFFTKKTVSDATSDLRRILRLDLP